MGKINWLRLLIGGLISGVVMNLLWWAAWPRLLQADVSEALQAVGRPLEESVLATVVS